MSVLDKPCVLCTGVTLDVLARDQCLACSAGHRTCVRCLRDRVFYTACECGDRSECSGFKYLCSECGTLSALTPEHVMVVIRGQWGSGLGGVTGLRMEDDAEADTHS